MKDVPTLEELVALVEQRAGTADPLSQLTEAVVVSGHLDELNDSLLGHFVAQARGAGATWEDIGECMGTSKQAAQKRFADRRQPRRGGFFLTRLTKEARHAVRDAAAHAREMGSAQVDPDHVLLGVLRHQSLVAQAISDLGASVDDVRSAIRARRDTGQRDRPHETYADGHIPFSAQSKKALELALREAIRSGDRRIGLEHIFLGILREGSSHGARALAEVGVTRKAFEERTETRG